MSLDRDVLLVVNPAAGKGRAGALQPTVERELRARGVTLRTELTRSIDHAAELGHEAARRGEAAVTLGGDGLAGAVAGGLHGVDPDGAVLGVLPGGRGNDLARVLGIPLDDIVAACAVIAEGRTRAIDLAEVDGRPYLGIASCGFDSDANRIANEAPAWVKGDLVYVYGALRALIAWKPARFEISYDGTTMAYTGYSFAAANSKAYGGGMYLAPDAELDDGLLDVVLVGDGPKRRYLQGLPSVFKGAHVSNPSVHILRAAEIRVTADRPFTVYADGDPIGELPVTIRVLRRAIRVIVP